MIPLMESKWGMIGLTDCPSCGKLVVWTPEEPLTEREMEEFKKQHPPMRHHCKPPKTGTQMAQSESGKVISIVSHRK